jgi:hypothetical protein
MKKTFLGRLPRSLTKSRYGLYDGTLVYVEKAHGEEWLIYGNQEAGPFDQVDWDSLSFLGGEPVYRATKEGIWSVFRGTLAIDTADKEIERLYYTADNILYYKKCTSQGNFLVWGPDSYGPYEHVGYPFCRVPYGPQFTARKNGKWYVVVGKTELGPYDELHNAAQSTQRADDKPLYVARIGADWFVFWGETRHGPFSMVAQYLVSHGHLTFTVRTHNDEWWVNFGSEVYGPYQKIGSFLWADKTRPCFAAQRADKWRVFSGNREIGAFNFEPRIFGINNGVPIFAANDDFWAGERKIATYDSIPTVSLGNGTVAAYGIRGRSVYLQQNDESIGPFDEICFAGDGHSRYYWETDGGEDGRIGVYYLAKTNRRWQFMCGKQTIWSYNFTKVRNLTMESGTLLFVGERNNQTFVMWGTTRCGPFQEVIDGPWITNGQVTAVVRCNDQIFVSQGSKLYGPYNETFSHNHNNELWSFSCGVLVGRLAYCLKL